MRRKSLCLIQKLLGCFGCFWLRRTLINLDNLDVEDIRGGHSEELIVGLVVHFQPLVDSVNRCKLQLRLSELATHTCNTKPLFCQKLLLFAHICVTTRWTQPISSGKILLNIPLLSLRCKLCQKWFSFLGNLTGKYDAIQQGEIDNGELRKYGKLNPGEI